MGVVVQGERSTTVSKARKIRRRHAFFATDDLQPTSKQNHRLRARTYPVRASLRRGSEWTVLWRSVARTRDPSWTW